MPRRRGVGWDGLMWPDKCFILGEKNISCMGRKGSFQVKQHPTGLIGRADDIIFSTEPGVCLRGPWWWYGLGFGWVMDGRV